MFILVDNRFISSDVLKALLEKLKNPYNDSDNLFAVRNVEIKNYTIATNGPLYDNLPNIKMVCKTKSKTPQIDNIYNELGKYSNFEENIEAIKNIFKTTSGLGSFCLAAINENGDYIVVNDKSGMDQIYSGTMKADSIIYSTYHINTYFKEYIGMIDVVPINCDNIITCVNNNIKHFNNAENKDIGIGKGIMNSEFITDDNILGFGSVFVPMIGNNKETSNILKYDLGLNENGVSIYDRKLQWIKVQHETPSDNPISTNIYYDKQFPNGVACKNYNTIVKVVSDDWIDGALEMESRGINPVLLNMTDKVFPAVDIHLGIGGQEESIFLRSNLNKALMIDKLYPFSNDNRIIYSKDIIIYYEGEKTKWANYKEPKKVSIISCPPVKSPYNLEYDYTKLFENSKMSPNHINTTRGYIENTLQAAIKNGHDGIVLPAFGCEGQKNPPRCVAEIMKEILEKYNSFFKEVFICIPGANDKLLGNYNIFKDVLEKKLKTIENSTEVSLEDILDEIN
jgi:uncharacterized protein (TIGR02452 family)